MGTVGIEVFKVIVNAILLLVTLFCISLMVILWIRLHNKKANIENIVLFLGYGCIFFYGATTLSFCLGDIIDYSPYLVGLPYNFASIFWGTANGFGYLLWMKRLYMVFHATAYKTSIIIYFILFILIIIFWMSQVIIGMVGMFYTLNVLQSQSMTFTIIDIILLIEDISDVIITISLLTLFLRKLFKVSQQYQLQYLQQKQTRFIMIATKLTVLTIFGCTTTQIVTLWAWIMTYFYAGNSNNINPSTSHLIELTLCSLDSFINSLCIFLTFKINQNFYIKLCQICNNACKKNCEKLNSNRNEYPLDQQINRPISMTLTSIQSIANKQMKMSTQSDYILVDEIK